MKPLKWMWGVWKSHGTRLLGVAIGMDAALASVSGLIPEDTLKFHLGFIAVATYLRGQMNSNVITQGGTMKLLLALIVFPGLVFATDKPSDPHAVASSQSTSSADALSDSVSSVVVSDTHPDHVTLKNVANVYPPNANTTATCYVGISGGAAVPGFAVSGGSAKLDSQCTLRMDAREFFLSGDAYTGRALLCMLDSAIKFHGSVEKCVAAAPRVAAENANAPSGEGASTRVEPVAAAAPCVSQDEVRDRERKVLDTCVRK